MLSCPQEKKRQRGGLRDFEGLGKEAEQDYSVFAYKCVHCRAITACRCGLYHLNGGAGVAVWRWTTWASTAF